MTVVLCGVGADTGNVDPVPPVADDGRFEYVPIPEKGPTSETATLGTMARRYGEGSLADLLDRVRPGSEGDWTSDDAAIRDQPVHHDPNFDALTYGEHRPGYVAKLRTLEPGDVVAFYGGFPSPSAAYKHRYLVGWFTVERAPASLDPGASHAEKAAVFDDHPHNAHAKRFAAHGDCYYHDPAFTDRPETVAVVPGREPGGLLDRAIRLTDRRQGPNYYMAAGVADALDPASVGENGVHMGGFKPAIRCAIDAERFRRFLDDRDGRVE